MPGKGSGGQQRGLSPRQRAWPGGTEDKLAQPPLVPRAPPPEGSQVSELGGWHSTSHPRAPTGAGTQQCSAYFWSKVAQLSHLPSEETEAQSDGGLVQGNQQDRAAEA